MRKIKAADVVLPSLSRQVHVAILLLTSTIALLTAFLTSDITKVGSAVQNKLAEPDLKLRAASICIAVLSVALMLIGYLFDITLWVQWKVVTLAWETATIIFILFDLLNVTPWFPPAALIVGLVVHIFAFSVLKKAFGYEHSPALLQHYLKTVILACVVIALILLALWAAWLVVPGIDSNPQHWQSAYSHAVQRDFGGDEVGQQRALVRFASPAILAYHYLVMAACAWMRKVFEAHRVETGDGSLPLGGALYTALGVLLLSLGGIYGAVSLSPYSDLVSGIALYFGVVTAASILFYLGYVIGGHRILMMALKDDTVKKAVDMLYSDYAKAAVTLLVLPFLPLVVGIDVLHQASRRCLWRRGLLRDQPSEDGWFTKELRHVREWEMASVFSLSMSLGIAAVAFRTIAAIVPPFMAWLSRRLASEAFAVILLASFAVSILMFLLPPVSGQMIYVPVSLIIIEKLGYKDAGEFTLAVTLATIFCLITKLVACAMQQKLIGAPFSSNVAVKKTFSLHTAPYRVARSILGQPGISFRKVIFLIGMPDWPVSVLCGVLGLPLCPVLLGTTPEFFKILPNCISMGFLMKSREVSDEERQRTFIVLFQTFFVIGVMIPGLLTVFTGFIVKRVMESHKEEFHDPSSGWYRDPQEAAIVAAIAQDELLAETVKNLTSWKVQPVWVRGILSLGALLASASVCMIAAKPFEAFDFKDPEALNKLPGGSLRGLVRKVGWVMLALAGAVCVCLTVFKLWSFQAARAVDDSSGSESSETSDETDVTLSLVSSQ